MPQLENGFTKIANELIEQFARIRISGESMQILWVIIRKLYGFKKKSDKIALSQFMQATGMKKPTVCRALKKLESMGLITIIKNGNDIASEYRLQKNMDKWKPLSKKIIVIKKDNLPLSFLSPTKETITKERGGVEKKQGKKSKPVKTEHEIIEDLRAGYPQLDIDIELQKMHNWLSAKPGRKFNKRFAVNWLNKALADWSQKQPKEAEYILSESQINIIMSLEEKIQKKKEAVNGDDKKSA